MHKQALTSRNTDSMTMFPHLAVLAASRFENCNSR